MDAFIKNLRIKNFKSIKDVELDCERINLFIGEPNVGKSNVLEAMSLMGAPYSSLDRKFMGEFIRYEDATDLFHFDNITEPIEVTSNIGSAFLRNIPNMSSYDLILGDKNIAKEAAEVWRSEAFQDLITKQDLRKNTIKIPYFYCGFQADGHKGGSSYINGTSSPIKKYTFIPYEKRHGEFFQLFLSPPYGVNLYTIVEKNNELKSKYGKEFKKYGLDLLMDIRGKKFEIQRRDEDLSYKIPYSSMADTLQRYIFYMAAIESNKDSIILLEEIESHSFPRYVQELAQKMIDTKDNQFFVTTHSPYLLNTVMSEKSDVAIFLATYEDFQTKITRLNDEEISELLNHGLDVFYNLKGLAHEQES
jgi:AAA15 family ATPase/GTPase